MTKYDDKQQSVGYTCNIDETPGIWIDGNGVANHYDAVVSDMQPTSISCRTADGSWQHHSVQPGFSLCVIDEYQNLIGALQSELIAASQISSEHLFPERTTVISGEPSESNLFAGWHKKHEHAVKHPDCLTCRNHHGGVEGGNWLCCAIHPHGPDADSCGDWEESNGET